uniref:Uncharacterized protein n=1 Tax=Plectus sambesii TaxID=2011161 RepID=A0A914UTM3_9BILA
MDIHNSTSLFNISDCELAYEMAHNPLIIAIRVVHIMACSIGIGASASFILVLTRRTVPLHVNVRLLLVSLAFAAIISCTVLLLIAIYGLVLTFSSLDSCRLLQSKSLCSLLRAPSSAAVYAMIIGNFIVGIERSIATVQYRTYEIQGSIQVGIGLLIVQ